MAKSNFKQTEIGLIPEDWDVKSLEEETDINMGQSPKSEFYNDEGNGTPFLQGIRTFGDKYPLFDTYTTKVTKKGKAGSVLFSVRAPVGEVNITDRDICIGRGLAAINMNNENNEFLFYLLKSFKKYTQNLETGSVFGSMSGKQLRMLRLPFPNSAEQRAIAKILSDLDSKIELLQKQNETLEKIGQAIFKHWFIDFEFPDEKGEPYKTSGGNLVKSEMGDIPEGWKIAKLGEYIDVQKGLSYKGKFLSENEEDIPLINLGTIAPHKGYRKKGIKFYTGEHKERHLVKPGDIVIANTDITQKRDVLGSPAIIPDFGSEEILFTHHIFAIRNKVFPSLFLYYLFQKKDYKIRARTYATGTTVLALPKDAILDYEFAVPSKEVFEKFGMFAKGVFNRIILNNKNILSLQKTRDLLLPKLMSGKIRVPIEVRT